MRLFLVRHGQSQANVDDLINDDPHEPVALTEQGRVQAQTAAEILRQQLRGEPFFMAWCSEFLRARQTAEILLAGMDSDLLEDVRINERHSNLNGQPTAAFNDLVRPDPLNIRPAGGEDFHEVMARMASFLESLKTYSQGPLLAVSHENPMQAVLALLGIEPAQAVRHRLANCAMIECQLVENHWQLRSCPTAER